MLNNAMKMKAAENRAKMEANIVMHSDAVFNKENGIWTVVSTDPKTGKVLDVQKFDEDDIRELVYKQARRCREFEQRRLRELENSKLIAAKKKGIADRIRMFAEYVEQH